MCRQSFKPLRKPFACIRFHKARLMASIHNDVAPRAWWRNILTDLHFWVPVSALAGGLILLQVIH